MRGQGLKRDSALRILHGDYQSSLFYQLYICCYCLPNLRGLDLRFRQVCRLDAVRTRVPAVMQKAFARLGVLSMKACISAPAGGMERLFSGLF